MKARGVPAGSPSHTASALLLLQQQKSMGTAVALLFQQECDLVSTEEMVVRMKRL